ncbi:MAG: SRPBCC domain-containing protein [Phycisphaerales bacterium]
MTATTTTAPHSSTAEQLHTLHITQEIHIDAPPATAFEALLEELGPGSQLPDGSPFPMKIEAWPGGRWYRDRGESGGHPFGHLWGHVQVIKAPALLELVGPMPMSYPAVNHVQYRLEPAGAGTRLTLTHRAFGLIPAEHRDGMPEGWRHGLERVRALAARKAGRP